MNDFSYKMLSVLPDSDARRLGALFGVLAEPNRLRILDALRGAGELCVGDLCALLGLEQSNASHQLRLLKDLRIVKNRRAGRLVFYSLDDDHVLGLLQDGLAHVREPGRAAQRTIATDQEQGA